MQAKENALRIVNNLARYRAGRKRDMSKWDMKGMYVAQFMLPLMSRAMDRAVHLVMDNPDKKSRVEWVDLDKCFSFQYSLKIKSLRYQVRHFEEMQRDGEVPVVFIWKGRYAVWNGNHRITAGLLLGRYRMKMKVYRL